MNNIVKSVLTGVSTAIIISVLIWTGNAVVNAIAWAKDLEEVRQEQIKTSTVVEQILEQQLKRDIRDISKEIMALELSRGGESWTDSDEKYYLMLIDALQQAQDELDSLED